MCIIYAHNTTCAHCQLSRFFATSWGAIGLKPVTLFLSVTSCVPYHGNAADQRQRRENVKDGRDKSYLCSLFEACLLLIIRLHRFQDLPKRGILHSKLRRGIKAGDVETAGFINKIL